MAAHQPRPPLSKEVRRQRPCVAGPLQGVSDVGRRSSLDLGALRRAQSAAGEIGRRCASLAMVEPADVDLSRATRLARRGRSAATERMGKNGEPSAVGSGRGGAASFERARHSVRAAGVDRSHREATGVGIDASASRSAVEGERQATEKVECPRFCSNVLPVLQWELLQMSIIRMSPFF